MWIWQQENWPHFTWDRNVIEPMLREARFNQGILLGKMASQSHDKKRNMLDTILANIVNSSAIEGEKLNAFSVRSSLVNKLGLAEENTFPTTEQTDGIAEILIDAIENLDSMLSLKRILNWREKLFPKGYAMLSPIMGGKLRAIQSQGKKLMQVVSINIKMGEPLRHAVHDAITSTTHCPYLIHCRPERMDRRDPATKPHPFAVLPDYLTKQFKKWRDKSGAYNHLPQNERPTFHDIRVLDIMLYFKAGYPKEYIMALAGHATEDMTNHYIDGHEQKEALQVAAGLDITKIDMKNINWKDQRIPRELAKLIDEEG